MRLPRCLRDCFEGVLNMDTPCREVYDRPLSQKRIKTSCVNNNNINNSKNSNHKKRITIKVIIIIIIVVVGVIAIVMLVVTARAKSISHSKE